MSKETEYFTSKGRVKGDPALTFKSNSAVITDPIQLYATRLERIWDTDLYTLDALPIDANAGWEHFLCVHLNNDRLIEKIAAKWPLRRSAKVHSFSHSTSRPLQVEPNRNVTWVGDPNQLLKYLHSDNLDESNRRIAVLFAEQMEFDSSQTEQLLAGLRDFIHQYRFATEKAQLTALGAAIRKFAMNMPWELFEVYANWFEPTATHTISNYVELELAKSVVWRLTYVRTNSGVSAPALLNVLASLASDYLKPRLVLQENYASIALNAIVATFLLSAYTSEREPSEILAKQVTDLKIDWFRELLQRRLLIATTSLEQSNGDFADKVRVLSQILR